MHLLYAFKASLLYRWKLNLVHYDRIKKTVRLNIFVSSLTFSSALTLARYLVIAGISLNPGTEAWGRRRSVTCVMWCARLSGWDEGPHSLFTRHRGFAAQMAVKASREFSEPGPRLTALSRLTLVIASKASDWAGPVLLPTREIFWRFLKF